MKQDVPIFFWKFYQIRSYVKFCFTMVPHGIRFYQSSCSFVLFFSFLFKMPLTLLWILPKSFWTIFLLVPFPPALFLQSSAGTICSYIGKCLHIQQQSPTTSRENPLFFPPFFCLFAYYLGGLTRIIIHKQLYVNSKLLYT